jgi:prephenate dehydrogenase
MNSIPQKYLKFSPRGLRDVTRISASDPLVWRDIFLTNRQQILKAIKIFESRLSRLTRAIKDKDSKTILDIIQNAKFKRETL